MRNLRNIIMAAASAAAVFASCCKKEVKLIVTNNSELTRTCETVEIPFKSLQKVCKDLTAENVVVTNFDKEIPSQVYTSTDGTDYLLFQVALNSGSCTEFTVKAGERNEYPVRAYSRYVPERADDYAWENDLIAGRIYGPALSAPRTIGCDIWLKCTDRIVMDEWFKKMDYHHNHGEGLDCYMVGKTLGGGAMVPANGGKIWTGDNYVTQEHFCDGPVRTSARFTHATIDADGTPVTITREMTLDAGSRFVKWTTVFDAPVDELPVALGAVMHEVIAREDGANYVSFTEKASDSKTPEIDGNVSIGLVLSPDVTVTEVGTLDGHAVVLATVPAGEAVVSWIGSGWSLGGVESPEAWAAAVKDFAYAVANPLEVKIL